MLLILFSLFLFRGDVDLVNKLHLLQEDDASKKKKKKKKKPDEPPYVHNHL